MNGITNNANRWNTQSRKPVQSRKLQTPGAPGTAQTGTHLSDSFQMEHLSYRDARVRISNSNGQQAHMRMQRAEYTYAEATTRLSEHKGADAFHQIREETLRIHKIVVTRILADVQQKPGSVEKGEEALQIPEEWNAENTSDRIVNFALGLRNAFEGNDEEFLKMVKGAVEEGFRQAREILGELPDEVRALTEETFSLIMEKLDRWAEGRENGSEVDGNEQTVVEENSGQDSVNYTA